MARLGELMVAAGILQAEQVEQALRAQVMWGGRLGTNLIELGFLDLDALSRAIGRQHRLPAALARHFEKVDRELQSQLSVDIAERFAVVPLVRIGPLGKIVIASISPLGKNPLAIIADELAIDPSLLVPSIAAELRIRYQLERIYRISRTARFMRSPGKSIPPIPRFVVSPSLGDEPDSQVEIRLPTDLQLGEPPAPVRSAGVPVSVLDTDLTIPFQARAAVALFELTPDVDVEVGATGPGLVEIDDAQTLPVDRVAVDEDLDDLTALVVVDADDLAVTVVEDESVRKDRRKYVRTLADALTPATDQVAVGVARPEPEPESEFEPDSDLDSDPETETERNALGRIQIRKAPLTSRDATDKTLSDATRAIRRSTDRDRVAELVVDAISRFVPSCDAALMLVVRGEVAIGWKGFVRSGATPQEVAVPMHQPGLVSRVVASNCIARVPARDRSPIDQLLVVSLGQQNGDLVVVPISITNQAMCVIAMVTAPKTPTAAAESIAVAAGAAFARLMRNAGR